MKKIIYLLIFDSLFLYSCVSIRYENIVYSDKFERFHLSHLDSVSNSLCVDQPIDLHDLYLERSLEILGLNDNESYLEICNISFNGLLGVYAVKFLLSDDKGDINIITFNTRDNSYKVKQKTNQSVFNFPFEKGVFFQNKYVSFDHCDILIIRKKSKINTIVNYNNSNKIKPYFDENEMINEIFFGKTVKVK